jgi:hypothetical protein
MPATEEAAPAVALSTLMAAGNAENGGGVATMAPPERKLTKETSVRLRARAFQVALGQELLTELRDVLGRDAVRLVRNGV